MVRVIAPPAVKSIPLVLELAFVFVTITLPKSVLIFNPVPLEPSARLSTITGPWLAISKALTLKLEAAHQEYAVGSFFTVTPALVALSLLSSQTP